MSALHRFADKSMTGSPKVAASTRAVFGGEGLAAAPSPTSGRACKKRPCRGRLEGPRGSTGRGRRGPSAAQSAPIVSPACLERNCSNLPETWLRTRRKRWYAFCTNGQRVCRNATSHRLLPRIHRPPGPIRARHQDPARGGDPVRRSRRFRSGRGVRRGRNLKGERCPGPKAPVSRSVGHRAAEEMSGHRGQARSAIPRRGLHIGPDGPACADHRRRAGTRWIVSCISAPEKGASADI